MEKYGILKKIKATKRLILNGLSCFHDYGRVWKIMEIIRFSLILL